MVSIAEVGDPQERDCNSSERKCKSMAVSRWDPQLNMDCAPEGVIENFTNRRFLIWER
jgi:hypothetical protein